MANDQDKEAASASMDTKAKAPPFSNYWRILSFGSKTEHATLVLATVCAAASGVALPLMNIVFGSLVTDFTGYFIPDSGVSEDRFKSSVNRNSLYIVYLFIGKFVLTYIAMLCFRVMGLRISAGLRLSYIRALFAQPVKRLDELSISDRLHIFFQALALIIAAFAIAFRYSWALTLATSSGILFIIVVYSITTPFLLKSQQAVEKADAKHATVASEVVSSIRTVFSLGAQSRLTEKHAKFVDESHRNGLHLAIMFAIQFGPIFFTIYACYSLAFWFGLKLYREGHIQNSGTVVIVFFSVLIVTGVMGNIVQPLMYVTKAIAASTNFFEIIDADRVDFGGLSEPEVTAQGDIEMQEVTFAYPTRPDVRVLSNFSACFRSGKTTALVGPSGSGKSTIVALLERWYELQSIQAQQISDEKEGGSANVKVIADGQIILDDHNIKAFDLRWWRSRIGLVQQEPFLFNDTIENNVSFGLIGTQWEDAQPEKKLEMVKHACEEAFADEFIAKLPQGYSTRVGEAGMKLSGGQRQRIAIARSIIRQPAILILDEATSSIDVQGEQIVQKALDRLSQNRTTIMIAHRLSTIRKADHIIVLRDGTKVEEGTHEQLVSIRDGLYSSLTKAQKLEEDETAQEDSSVAEHQEAVDGEISRQVSEKRKVPSSDTAYTDAENGAVPYKERGFLRTVGILLYEQRPQWLFYGIAVLAAMACGTANAIQSWLFAQLIQAFTFVGQKLVDAANFWALMFFILAIAVSIAYATLGYTSGRCSTHVGTATRKDYFRNTLKMPISYFEQEQNSSSTIMSRLSADPKQLQDLLGMSSAFPLISMFNMIGSIIISFYFGWKLTLVTVFAVMPIIVGGWFIRIRYEIQFEALDSKVFEGSSQFATEAIGAFRTVSSLAMEQTIIRKYESLLKEQIKKSTRKAGYAMLVFAFADSIELCGMALTFWYGGQLLASREYQPLQFFVIYAAIIQGAQAAGQYLSITPNIARSTSSGNRMLELRSTVGGQRLPSAMASSDTDTVLGAKVEFKSVNFSYPGHTELFSNLNITIQPGQFVAFVGPSGCGKTTTISLLERFYDPTSGTIILDDQDITTLDPEKYRRNLSLVAQEPRLFSGTIRQNLLLGVEESTISDDQIDQACRDAEIYDFIISLPEGYNTELGLNTQTALSGGQKQRICLARALLRRPKLLLLDEATSSLDSQSERLVQSAIERLAGQRSMTVIAVAHRLATIQNADVIFVFGERDVDKRKGTKIVEMGTHRELLGRRGVYWAMCQIQTLDR